jgi:glutamate transport system permease protein
MSKQQSVLYDAPGPTTRLLTWIISPVAGLLALVGAYFLIYKPLKSKGQLSMDLWGPLIDPGNENFKQVWTRFGEGFKATLTAAVLAIACSLILGTALAILRVQLKAVMKRRFADMGGIGLVVRGLVIVLNTVTRLCVEVFRGIPVVITIFFVWVLLSKTGAEDLDLGFVTIPSLLYTLVLGLTIYNGVVIGEILRSGMEGLPSGQREAADAIGLSTFQTLYLVLMPQAFRIMLPALISQLVVVLKDTSLGFIITYEEILKVASQTIGVLGNSIPTYIVIAVIYIAINYTLSKVAEFTQRRLARGRRTPRAADIAPPASLAAQVKV